MNFFVCLSVPRKVSCIRHLPSAVEAFAQGSVRHTKLAAEGIHAELSNLIAVLDGEFLDSVLQMPRLHRQYIRALSLSLSLVGAVMVPLHDRGLEDVSI